jgi:hypothetical protein
MDRLFYEDDRDDNGMEGCQENAQDAEVEVDDSSGCTAISVPYSIGDYERQKGERYGL